MAKTRDFRPELRHFVKVLNSFRGYYYDYDIFSDFIDYATACLLWNGDPELAERLKSKYKDDYPRFREMYVALLSTMSDQLPEGPAWYDALGTLYEEISSRQKSSMLGQFFTPPEVCNFMAQINAPQERLERRIMVNDPAAGSGRTLLAFNAVYPGAYIIAQDLDPICTKMSAINMALHGIQGQSVNGDALNPDSYRFGFEVNSRLYTLGGFPHLHRIDREQSQAYIMWQNQLNRKEEPIQEPPKLPEQPPQPPQPLQPLLEAQQLSLF
jgi:type I restriction enzyme M protein